MSKKALFGLVMVLFAVTSSVVIATRPGRYRVRRSADAQVSAEAVFALASNPAAWAQWSPWVPGTVKMTLVGVRPPARVTMRLELADPVPSVAIATIEIQPAPNHTAVTWTVEGTLGFAGKARSLVTGMDAALGPKLERGLGNLGRLPELTRRWGQLAQASVAR